MIFYLKPPKSIIDLRNFNGCCFTRLKYFLQFLSNSDDVDDIFEAVIPGTELDKIGHFILRCFCSHNPDVTDFILKKETDLFLYRLEQQTSNEIRQYCKTVIKDIHCLKTYTELNLLSKCLEKPYFGTMILSSLECICRTLMKKDINHHFKIKCDENCEKYILEVPFQVCQKLVKSRDIKIRKGIAEVPCSKWSILLEELFIHHYHFGLSMISYSLLCDINNDVRWLTAFKKLQNLYHSHQYKKPLPQQKISAKQVDYEKQFFPPCMSHLLTVLRSNHRLSHNWRYYFSLFLKDTGLTIEESMNFWKSEYSKSCTPGSSCTHSWQRNERKYKYSIRHLYGLEGSKRKVQSKRCRKLQMMTLGMRDEGGCPFVHFDESTLLSTLSETVIQNNDIRSQIIELKNTDKPFNACSLYTSKLLEILSDSKIGDNVTIEYESPIEYYFSVKSYLKQSLDW